MRTEKDLIGDAHEPFWAGETAEEGDGLVASIGLGAAWTVQSLCSFSPQDSQPHAPAYWRLDQPTFWVLVQRQLSLASVSVACLLEPTIQCSPITFESSLGPCIFSAHIYLSSRMNKINQTPPSSQQRCYLAPVHR